MIPLSVGSVKGLLGSTAKNAVKKKALGTAKDFVAGKKKGKKGGALVKIQSADNSGNKTKAKVKPTGGVKAAFLTLKKMNKTRLLEQLLDKAIRIVDEDLDVKDFAVSVAGILENNYGDHNYELFLETLKNELNK